MPAHILPHRPSRFSFFRLFAALPRALRLHRSRRDLLQLEPHLLRDIGLTPEQAAREAMRPIWDAPEAWSARD